jgi:hypothetical protein
MVELFQHMLSRLYAGYLNCETETTMNYEPMNYAIPKPLL